LIQAKQITLDRREALPTGVEPISHPGDGLIDPAGFGKMPRRDGLGGYARVRVVNIALPNR